MLSISPVHQKIKTFLLTISVGTAFIYYISQVLRRSVLNPHKFPGDDSAVFVTMGYSWLQGLIPYKDLFDHKGPLLYLVNAAGFALMDGEAGILLLQSCFAFLLVLLTLLMFRSNLFFGVFILLFFGFTLFRKTYDGGNLTEEYALLFNTVSVALYCRKKFSQDARFFTYGITGACAFMLRPNLAIVSLVIVFFELLDTKSIKKTIRGITTCGLGFLAFCIPIISYFYLKDALFHFYDCFILFNIKYSSQQNIYQKVLIIGHQLWEYRLSTIMLIFLASAPLLRSQFKRVIKSYAFICFVIVISNISGLPFSHYHLTLLPVCFYVAFNFIDTFNVQKTSNCQYNTSKNIYAFSLIIGFTLMLANTLMIVKTIEVLNSDRKDGIIESLHELSPGTPILNLGNHMGSKVFTILREVPDQRVFYPATANPDAGKENDIFKNIDTVVSQGNYDFILSKIELDLEGYHLVGEWFGNLAYKKWKKSDHHKKN